MAHCFLFCSSCSRRSSSRRAKERTIQYLKKGVGQSHIFNSTSTRSRRSQKVTKDCLLYTDISILASLLVINLLEPGKTCHNISSLKNVGNYFQNQSDLSHLDSKGGKQSRDDKDEKNPDERWRWNQPSQFAFRLLWFGLAWVRSEGGQLEERGEGHPGSAAHAMSQNNRRSSM